jgi:DNA-binding NtrC family response regulator
VPTILLVEEDDTILAIFKTALSRRGYETLEAITPEEAKRLCNRHMGKLDLLITNVMHRRTSGPEFASELSAADPKLKTIFVSRRPMEGWYDAEFRALSKLPVGSYAFLAKPFNLQDLVGKVDELLKNGDGMVSRGA